MIPNNNTGYLRRAEVSGRGSGRRVERPGPYRPGGYWRRLEKPPAQPSLFWASARRYGHLRLHLHCL